MGVCYALPRSDDLSVSHDTNSQRSISISVRSRSRSHHRYPLGASPLNSLGDGANISYESRGGGHTKASWHAHEKQPHHLSTSSAANSGFNLPEPTTFSPPTSSCHAHPQLPPAPAFVPRQRTGGNNISACSMTNEERYQPTSTPLPIHPPQAHPHRALGPSRHQSISTLLLPSNAPYLSSASSVNGLCPEPVDCTEIEEYYADDNLEYQEYARRWEAVKAAEITAAEKAEETMKEAKKSPQAQAKLEAEWESAGRSLFFGLQAQRQQEARALSRLSMDAQILLGQVPPAAPDSTGVGAEQETFDLDVRSTCTSPVPTHLPRTLQSRPSSVLEELQPIAPGGSSGMASPYLAQPASLLDFMQELVTLSSRLSSTTSTRLGSPTFPSTSSSTSSSICSCTSSSLSSSLSSTAGRHAWRGSVVGGIPSATVLSHPYSPSASTYAVPVTFEDRPGGVPSSTKSPLITHHSSPPASGTLISPPSTPAKSGSGPARGRILPTHRRISSVNLHRTTPSPPPRPSLLINYPSVPVAMSPVLTAPLPLTQATTAPAATLGAHTVATYTPATGHLAIEVIRAP